MQQQTGDGGERCACSYLQQQGWAIAARQWRCKWGELDIVAVRDSALAFVEVKTRSSSGWDESGLLAINGHKQRKIIRAARAYLARYPQYSDRDCQFDVALVRSHNRAGCVTYELRDYVANAFEVA